MVLRRIQTFTYLRFAPVQGNGETSEGVTLIQVPYWWDKSVASLAATILKYRPDIELVCSLVCVSH